MEKLSDHNILKGSDTLLVTLGDSWTWGNNLENRNEESYGKLLSTALNADWVNIAKCGCSNFWILDKLYKLLAANTVDIITEISYNNIKAINWPTYEQFLIDQPKKLYDELREVCSYDVYEHEIIKNYKNLYIVITLSETGREFNDMAAPYNLQSIDDYLKRIEQTFFTKVKNLIEKNDVKIVIGRNFSINYPNTVAYYMMDKNWIEIASNRNFSNILHYGPISGIGLNFLHSHPAVSHLNAKEYFIQQTDKVAEVIEFLATHELFIRKYPNPKAHKLWANYILQNMAL